jgi:predicted acetyltransferase
MTAGTTHLSPAGQAEHQVLSNLLELYIHDLSAAFPHVQLGADGRFGYPGLATYWAEPERRFAFLIRESGQLAGFILATRGSPVVTDPDVYDVAEFFVLRRYRRAGVGRRAASLLWRERPGHWVVRVAEANRNALEFWARVVGEREASPGGSTVKRWARPGTPSAWHVFELDSSAAGEDPI